MILEQTDEDTKPIPHRGPKANLVGLGAIMSRNRDLPYPESLFLKLNEDLRVKMKLIRALFKGHLSQGFAGISPKAGVVFGELHSERPIFDSGEEPVPASKAMIKMPTSFMPPSITACSELAPARTARLPRRAHQMEFLPAEWTRGSSLYNPSPMPSKMDSHDLAREIRKRGQVLPVSSPSLPRGSIDRRGGSAPARPARPNEY